MTTTTMTMDVERDNDGQEYWNVSSEINEHLDYLFEYFTGHKLYIDGSEPMFFVVKGVSSDRKKCAVARKTALLVRRDGDVAAHYEGDWNGPSLDVHEMPMDAVQDMLLVDAKTKLFQYTVGDQLYMESKDSSEPMFFVVAGVSKDGTFVVDRKSARLMFRNSSGDGYYFGNWDEPSIGLYTMPMGAVRKMLHVEKNIHVVVETKQIM